MEWKVLKGDQTYDFEELSLDRVFPAFRFHFFRDTEDLIHCARDHTRQCFCLNQHSEYAPIIMS